MKTEHQTVISWLQIITVIVSLGGLVWWQGQEMHRIDDRHRTDKLEIEERCNRIDARWQWLFEKIDARLTALEIRSMQNK